MEKRWSHKVGAGVLSQLPVSPGDWSSVMPHLRLTFWRRAQKGWLHMHDWNDPKSFLYIRGMHQTNFHKWSRSVPLSLLPFFHFLCFTNPYLDHPHGRTNVGSKGLVVFVLFLSFPPLFLSCFALGKSCLSYSTPSSILRFAVGVGRFRRCVVTFNPAPFRSLLWELRVYWSVL